MAKSNGSESQLVPIEPGAVAPVGGYESEAGGGFEEAGHDSFAVPMLRILHKQSPQCDATAGMYIEGAKQGSIFNTVTREIMDDVIVIPCHYRKTFLEWIPRTSGGGFVGEHKVKPAEAQPQSNGPDVMSNGNEIQETMNHYCLLMQSDMVSADPVLISMSSVQRRKSRNWMTAMRGKYGTRPDGTTFPLPMYACSYKLATVPEQNDKGNWAGWLIDPHQWVTDGSALFEKAKQLKKSCQDDVIEVNRDETVTIVEGDEQPY